MKSSFRWKIIFVFLLSLILSVACAFALLGMAFLLYRFSTFQTMLRYAYHSIGILPCMITVGVLFFFIFYYVLTKRSISYFEEISRTLKKISEGRLDVRIPVRSTDELGMLAGNINNMMDQLKTSIEVERNSERSKNELITSVSHDLRTPLTSILGYLGLIVNNRYRDEAELRYYADIAYQKTIRLNKLIDELFEFTRINYGGIELRPVRINLGELLEQLTEEFYPIFENGGLECSLNIPQEKVLIMADGDLLARVFDNLVTNAVRYGSEGKKIDIVMKTDNDSALISVTNYGTTIPENAMPHIFERFYRVEQSRSVKTGGTGLGLAIAKNIVDLHGGNLSVSSNNGQTTFTVILKLNN
ncbi:MAG: HAMP domain-containing sensor histidine kinase [Bacillota bacterium]|nr:HAMP domain-containing sensor histidine kinase [Bacillota bacterium]